MERMEETVVDADDQRLQHMLTDSAWDHRAVLDQVALEVLVSYRMSIVTDDAGQGFTHKSYGVCETYNAPVTND